MRRILIILLILPLGGCWVNAREPAVYTQAEIDAQNARIQCRAIAKTIVQIMRCDGGR